MQTVTDQEFKDVPVELDGKHFERCKFINCTLIYSGGDLPTFTETFGHGGSWQMSGAAGRTLNFLYRMNQINPEMVDQIIAKIKTPVKK